MDILTSLPPSALSALVVDLSALKRNYKSLRESFSGERVGAVVKDDAYSMGFEGVVPALCQAGCGDFFVTTLEEALAIKDYVPVDAAIYILNGFYPGSEEGILEHGFIPTLISYSQVEKWSQKAKSLGKKLKTVIHFDTGMSRTGLSTSEAERLIANQELLYWLDIRYWMSHLACSHIPHHPLNKRQLECFKNIVRHLPPAKISFVNSDGIFMDQTYHCDLARPGLSLYGLNTYSSTLENVLSVYAKILQIRDVSAGDTVGYDARYCFDEPGRIATLSVGYAQGWSTRLSNHSHVAIEGIKAPVRGRISMDLMGVDITHLPKNKVHENQWVEILGQTISPKELAKAGRTITYEIILSIRNHHRIYKDN